MKRRLLLALVACLAPALPACTTVKPYERELLAQPGMSLDPTPEVEAEQHMLQAREAASGGYGTAGGGCGCN